MLTGNTPETKWKHLGNILLETGQKPNEMHVVIGCKETLRIWGLPSLPLAYIMISKIRAGTSLRFVLAM